MPAPSQPTAPLPVPAQVPSYPPQDEHIPVPKAADSEEFCVSDPVKGGHTTYTVRGRDNDGEFEGTRRYNDFHIVRDHLVKNWPGCYVPPVPPKKMTGNKGETFIEERCYFLDRFLKLIGRNPHLLNSDTFKAFSRPSGEVEKVLAMHPKPTPEIIIERYKTALFIDEFPDESLVRQSKDTINEFSAFCKRVAPVLMKIKKQAAALRNNNITSLTTDLLTSLTKYEEETITTYADCNANKLVLGDINDTEIKDKSEELSATLKNPYVEFYNWVKGECDDIESLYESIKARDDLTTTKQKVESKKKSEEKELEKLNQGKRTFKTLLKSSSGR